MAKIRVDLSYTIVDGSDVVFTAPCNCSAVDGLKVCYPDGEKEFIFKDAHGNALTGIGNLFAKGALVKVILDVTNGHAFIQNADTNAYIEKTFAKKVDKVAVGGYSDESATDEAALEAWLESTILPSMADNSHTNIVFKCGAICPWVLMGAVYKHTNQWVVIELTSHVDGHRYTKIKNETWQKTFCAEAVYTMGEMEATAAYFPKICKFFIVNVFIGAGYGGEYHSFAVDAYTLQDGEKRYFDYFTPWWMLDNSNNQTVTRSGCRLTVQKRESKKDVAFTLKAMDNTPGDAHITRIVGYC